MKVPFSPPDMTEIEANNAHKAVLSGWITTGPETKGFEQDITEYCGAKKTACLNSATAALELSLRILGVKPGDEVIVPAYTYTSSASVVCHVGANIVFVDSEKDRPHISTDGIRKAITDKTKAIIAVDFGGIPVDYDAIYAAVEDNKSLFNPENDMQKQLGRIAVIGDCAHSFGSMYKGKNVANCSDFACFSFHAVKNLTTAEGGAVCFKDVGNISCDEIYNKFMLYSLHGQNKDAFAKTKLGAWEYDIILPGYKCNMTDILASIGRVQLSRYDGLTEKRKALSELYDKHILKLGIKTYAQTSEQYDGNYHLYPIRFDRITEQERNEIITKLAKQGIAANVHFKPLPMMTAYKNLGHDINNFDNAYNLYKNEITLPLYSTLNDEQVIYICEKLAKIVEDLKCWQT